MLAGVCGNATASGGIATMAPEIEDTLRCNAQPHNPTGTLLLPHFDGGGSVTAVCVVL